MKVKSIIIEDFLNYKQPSMFIISSICNWKCCIEQNLDISMCQNSSIAKQKTVDISPEIIYNMFIKNPITKAIVIGGLEPIDQINEVIQIIDYFRKNNNNSPFVIYTGYYPYEIKNSLNRLKNYNNIIVKFGRFIPNAKHRYDEILGIELVSDNQYAEVIS